MATYRWDPFSSLSRLDRDFDELVRRTWAAPRTRVVRSARPSTGFVPPVELVRDGSDVVVRAELPGIDIEKDVTVEIERGRLVLRGERRNQREDSNDGVFVREVRYGSFRREFSLPEGVSADAIEATYDAGVLEVRVRGAIREVRTAERFPVTSGTAQAVESPATGQESVPEQSSETTSEPTSEPTSESTSADTATA